MTEFKIQFELIITPHIRSDSTRWMIKEHTLFYLMLSKMVITEECVMHYIGSLAAQFAVQLDF